MSTQSPQGPYVPSPAEPVRGQVEQIERTGTTASVHIQNLPVVLLTMTGAKSGAVRKVPLMRVERDGRYAAVASLGGAPRHPQWYFNLKADPDLLLQDGTETTPMRARELEGAERDDWWQACVAAFPPYASYARKTDRAIPVFVLEPR